MGQCCASCCGDDKKKDDCKNDKNGSSKKNKGSSKKDNKAGVNTSSKSAKKPPTAPPADKSTTKKQIPPQLKMAPAPKVKIVIDEGRILKAIKEKESLDNEVAMIGKTKQANKSALSDVFKSTASVSPKGTFKDKSVMANSKKSAAPSTAGGVLSNRNETMSNDFNSRRASHATSSGKTLAVSSLIGHDPYQSSATGMDSSLKPSNISSDVVASSVMSEHGSSSTTAVAPK